MKVDVAIPKTKFDFFTYNSQDNLQVGDLVLVPLRNESKYGIVVKTNSQRDISGIKNVKKLVEEKFIPKKLVELYKWIADYYLSTQGEVLRLAIPSKILKKYEPTTRYVKTAKLIKTPTPTYQQSNAIKRILGALKNGHFKTFLLYGITGSGKTEVYLRCVEKVVNNGGRALVLVPEISMTPLLFNRFRERFNDQVVTIHSALSDKERRNIWYAIKNGTYKIVIGPRSTIFVPIPDLKIIIIDEEHDQSYKEHERMPLYNARDVAVMRGKFENTVVVLGSATPQLESYYNAGIGKYTLLTLKERIDNKSLPHIEMIDLRQENKKFISPKLETKIGETLRSKEQMIIFLNRRGFAPNLICPFCGFVAQCPYCGLPLVYHKSERKKAASLSCHICSYKSHIITICPKCSRGTLLYRGAGTQRIEEIINRIIEVSDLSSELPNKESVVLRLDRDSAKRKGQAEKIFKTFEQGKAQVLLGTQLVTKGFDFPQVTLVGIVNADIILNLPDFRSNERTFQMLTQVAGRSGRGRKPGVVFMQTYHPEQYSILFSLLQDYPEFYAQEIKLRKELKFPPFTKLVLIRVKGKNENKVWREAEKITRIIERAKSVEIFGPNRSYYYKIRKDYRVFILCKISKIFKREKLKILNSYKVEGCKLQIDVDPLDTL
jgi:primosomal protein N' (replication factor Y)